MTTLAINFNNDNDVDDDDASNYRKKWPAKQKINTNSSCDTYYDAEHGKGKNEGMEDVMDSFILAEEELKQKKIPYIIERPLPHGTSVEYWPLDELEIL